MGPTDASPAPPVERHYLVDLTGGAPRLAARTFVYRAGGRLIVSDQPLPDGAAALAGLDLPAEGEVLLGVARRRAPATPMSFSDGAARVFLHVVGDGAAPWRDDPRRLLAVAALAAGAEIALEPAIATGSARSRRLAPLAVLAMLPLLLVGAIGGWLVGRSAAPAAGRAAASPPDLGQDGGLLARPDAPPVAPARALATRVMRAADYAALAGAAASSAAPPETFCDRHGDLVSLTPERLVYVLCGDEAGPRTRSVCADGRCQELDLRIEKRLPARLCTRDGATTSLVKRARRLFYQKIGVACPPARYPVGEAAPLPPAPLSLPLPLPETAGGTAATPAALEAALAAAPVRAALERWRAHLQEHGGHLHAVVAYADWQGAPRAECRARVARGKTLARLVSDRLAALGAGAATLAPGGRWRACNPAPGGLPGVARGVLLVEGDPSSCDCPGTR